MIPELTDRLAEVERLEAAGQVVAALDLLMDVERGTPSPGLREELVLLRHRAAAALRSVPRSPWPPKFDDPFPDVVGLVPEIPAAELTADVVSATIEHHGSIIVRGLFDADQIARTRAAIDRALDARTDDIQSGSGPDYNPQLGTRGVPAKLRQLVSPHGVWLADSPSALADVLDDLERSGTLDAVRGHFAERPLISLQKSTLRRVLPEYRLTGWHQDGSFLGRDTRALNVWVTLTACGGDRPAPGLQLVGGRVPVLLEADGGTGRASINGVAVHYQAKATGLPITQPEFEPGDALLFDELMAHRTYLNEAMTEVRYALECWFFSPAFPADEYISLVV